MTQALSDGTQGGGGRGLGMLQSRRGGSLLGGDSFSAGS